jgi:hypothetical protein
MLTLRFNHLNYPCGAGLEPTPQPWNRSNTYKRHLLYKEQQTSCVNFHLDEVTQANGIFIF